jgi:putative transposase
MPRRPGLYLPGYPCHIVQRGTNSEACFVEPENCQYYPEPWKEHAGRHGVAVHAFFLMTKYIHFLVSPEHGIKGSEQDKGGRSDLS